MNWKTIRLELARTESFPHGSAGRVYLLRLPLDPHGLIDREAHDRNPLKATVQRFWASEPDQHGLIEQANGDWVFRCRRSHLSEAVIRFKSQPLLPTREVMVEEANGTRLPFTVASVRSLGVRSAATV